MGMKISGYVSLEIASSMVDCMNCDESVATASIENLEEISPNDYTIIIECEPCVCGFVNVLEYVEKPQYSVNESVSRSNDRLDTTCVSITGIPRTLRFGGHITPPSETIYTYEVEE